MMKQHDKARVVAMWAEAQSWETRGEYGNADRCWAEIQDIAHGCAFRGPRRDTAAYLLYLTASERRGMNQKAWKGRAW